MTCFGCRRASRRALFFRGASLRWAPLVGIVFLGASLAACFDSKRIIFTGEANRPDAGGAGGAPPAPQSQASRAEPASVFPAGIERVAEPDVVDARALAADASVALDAGVATGSVDAAAPDAAP